MDEPTKQQFLDVNTMDGYTAKQLTDDKAMVELLERLFGETLLTKKILQTPTLCVYHETAQPHEKVPPHRHGTTQVDYVLKGELHFGNKVLSAGMAFVNPDRPYSWQAGPEGAEWLEIHSGVPSIITDDDQT